MLIQALAAVSGATGHASEAFCALVKANLKSFGARNPFACSHDWNFESVSSETELMNKWEWVSSLE